MWFPSRKKWIWPIDNLNIVNLWLAISSDCCKSPSTSSAPAAMILLKCPSRAALVLFKPEGPSIILRGTAASTLPPAKAPSTTKWPHWEKNRPQRSYYSKDNSARISS